MIVDNDEWRMDIGRIGKKGEINKYDSYAPVERPLLEIGAIAVTEVPVDTAEGTIKIKGVGAVVVEHVLDCITPGPFPSGAGVFEFGEHIIISAKGGGLVVSKCGR